MIVAKEVIRKCRVHLLKDVDADDYVWSDKRLLDALNNAIQKALRIRPLLQWETIRICHPAEDFIVEALTYEDEETGEEVDTIIPFPASYEEALVYGTASDIYINLDADQAMQQQGQNFEGKFLQLLRI